jgi:hypothetical protein
MQSVDADLANRVRALVHRVQRAARLIDARIDAAVRKADALGIGVELELHTVRRLLLEARQLFRRELRALQHLLVHRRTAARLARDLMVDAQPPLPLLKGVWRHTIEQWWGGGGAARWA